MLCNVARATSGVGPTRIDRPALRRSLSLDAPALGRASPTSNSSTNLRCRRVLGGARGAWLQRRDVRRTVTGSDIALKAHFDVTVNANGASRPGRQA
jgi:hypothetical protein